MRRAVAWVAALSASLVASVAYGAPSARLVYVRSAEAAACPDETVVRAAVAARLGYDPFLHDARSTLVAEVRKEGSRYVARIQLVDDGSVVRGARELSHEGEPCSEIVDLMALSMSIAIDPLSLAPRPPPPPATEPGPSGEATSTAEPAPAEPTPPAATAGRAEPPTPAPRAPGHAPRPRSLELAFGVEASFGSAPAPAAGARLGVRGWLGDAAAFVEGRADLPASGVAGRGTVSTSLTGVGAGLCYRVRFAHGCAVGVAGVLAATTEGITTPRSESGPFGALGPRLGADLELTRGLALRGQLEVLVPVTPSTATVDGAEVARIGPILAGTSAHVVVRFF